MILTGSVPPKLADHTMVLFRDYLYIFAGCNDIVRYNDMHRINLLNKTVVNV